MDWKQPVWYFTNRIGRHEVLLSIDHHYNKIWGIPSIKSTRTSSTLYLLCTLTVNSLLIRFRTWRSGNIRLQSVRDNLFLKLAASLESRHFPEEYLVFFGYHFTCICLSVYMYLSLTNFHVADISMLRPSYIGLLIYLRLFKLCAIFKKQMH